VNPEFWVDRFAVIVNRAPGDLQLFANFWVGRPAGNSSCNIEFAPGNDGSRADLFDLGSFLRPEVADKTRHDRVGGGARIPGQHLLAGKDRPRFVLHPELVALAGF